MLKLGTCNLKVILLELPNYEEDNKKNNDVSSNLIFGYRKHRFNN